MTDPAPGFFGKIPAAGDFVVWNLPRDFTDRWDRWFSAELRLRPDNGPLDPRTWRFGAPPGVFGAREAAGAWRMSEDRAGRRYPFVVARLAPIPDPDDPWFDGVAAVLSAAVEDVRPPAQLIERLQRLPGPSTTIAIAGPERIAFWLGGPKAQELSFADLHDLADNGLPALRAARSDAEAI
jgi:type VI secretion system protein ImpM